MISRLRLCSQYKFSRRYFCDKGWGSGSPHENTWKHANIFSGNVGMNASDAVHQNMPERKWRDLAVIDYGEMVDNGKISVESLRKKLKWMASKRGWAEIEPILIAFTTDVRLQELSKQDVL